MTRDALQAGQWWRLLTAHVIHLGYEHAVLDIAGLGVDVGAVHPGLFSGSLVANHRLGGDWRRCRTVAAVFDHAVVCGFLRSAPRSAAAGTCAHLRRREPDGWILVLFLIGKLVYEQAQGALPLTAGGAVIVDAHLYGAVGGALAVLFLRGRAKPV